MLGVALDASHISFHGREVEFLNLDVLNEGVEFTLGVLVLIAAAGDADTDLAGHVSDAVGPHESVEGGVDADILGEHLLLGESLDVADAAGSSLLELDTLEHLVDVEGVVAAGGLHLSLCRKQLNQQHLQFVVVLLEAGNLD